MSSNQILKKAYVHVRIENLFLFLESFKQMTTNMLPARILRIHKKTIDVRKNRHEALGYQ